MIKSWAKTWMINKYLMIFDPVVDPAMELDAEVVTAGVDPPKGELVHPVQALLAVL